MNKEWWKAAGIRALKTFAQAAIAAFGTAVVLQDVNWIYVGSSAALAAVISILTSIAGLPEVRMANEVKLLAAEVEKLKVEKEKLCEEVEKNELDG